MQFKQAILIKNRPIYPPHTTTITIAVVTNTAAVATGSYYSSYLVTMSPVSLKLGLPTVRIFPALS
jgi:hypothetical protein